MATNIINFPKKIIAFLIFIYQKTVSFDHGIPSRFYPYGFCRFSPTCSEYSRQAVLRHGVLKGGVFGAWRIVRCNPWSAGGKDPIK